jgi:hypothetical protein
MNTNEKELEQALNERNAEIALLTAELNERTEQRNDMGRLIAYMATSVGLCETGANLSSTQLTGFCADMLVIMHAPNRYEETALMLLAQLLDIANHVGIAWKMPTTSEQAFLALEYLSTQIKNHITALKAQPGDLV